MAAYISKFVVYVEPITNLLFAIYHFYKRNQDHSETVEQYVTSLKVLANTVHLGIQNMKVSEID